MIQAHFTSKRRRDGEYDTPPPPTQPQTPPRKYKWNLNKGWPRLSATAQIGLEEAPGRKDVSATFA